MKTLMLTLAGVSLWCTLVFAEAPDVDTTQNVPLTTVTLVEWEQALADYHGEITVVDFWATWCISCLERFPHMVTMSEQFKDQKVRFVSMLLEDPEETDTIERAHQFLNKQFQNKSVLAFDHYFMNENLMKSFESLDLLGIPAVFIYDSKGQLAHRLTGDNPNKQFTDKDIEAAIQQMITK